MMFNLLKTLMHMAVHLAKLQSKALSAMNLVYTNHIPSSVKARSGCGRQPLRTTEEEMEEKLDSAASIAAVYQN